MPLNVLIDLSQMFYNQDKAKSNFQAFQRVFFNSSIPTRLIRNSEQLGDAETDLLFHFDHSTIDRNDIYRKNYKMVVTYEPAFMIRGKNWNDNYSYSADINIYILRRPNAISHDGNDITVMITVISHYDNDITHISHFCAYNDIVFHAYIVGNLSNNILLQIS